MYTEAEAARLLGVPPSTLHYWLEGGERRGKRYPPILREASRGENIVTWGEFVEAGLLRAYRRTHHVPMRELRKFVDHLREELGVPYPLADRRPFVSGRQLIYNAQGEAGLDPEFCLVAVASDQLVLLPASQDFLDRVEWDGDQAAAWRPDANLDSPVRVSPTIRFGKPAINGISTEVIWEHDKDDEEDEAIAETFQLSVAEVRWALAYEYTQRAA